MDDDALLKTHRALTEALACVEALMSRRTDCPLERALQLRARPFDCELVRTADLVERFGVSKEDAAAFLNAKGAVPLPRCTRGKGMPAYQLWAMRDAERWRSVPGPMRVRAYEAVRSTFDPLEG